MKPCHSRTGKRQTAMYSGSITALSMQAVELWFSSVEKEYALRSWSNDL